MDGGCKTVLKRTLLDLDPDYKEGHVSEAKRRCLVEESGQGQAQQRVVEVIGRELDIVSAEKESEALQLQERVQECQRFLRLLRIGVTSTFYKNIPSSGQTSTSTNSSRNSEGQSALHPAVMRLLAPGGGGPKTRGVRNNVRNSSEASVEVFPEVADDSSSFQSDSSDSERKCHDENENEKKRGKDGCENEEKKAEEESLKREELCRVKMPRYIPPILPKPPEVCAASARMERHRIKRRLVVGNISKWLPEDVREDAATHKWMLYLRGPKDFPDISDVIAKVRYFLHPSYRPHDIVDVVSPYYLARRGWGEFPVRVQVHFSIDGNQPIDIIHFLKLDRTYSGLQTLGGETVVDVWLNNMPSKQNVENLRVPCNQQNVQEQLFTESQTTVFGDGQHEIMAHDTQTVVVKQEIDEEEEDLLEDLESGIETKGKLEQGGDFSQDDDGNESEKQVENPNCKIKIASTNIQVKNETVHVESKVNTISCSLNEDSSKPYLSHLYVFHTLPDHDYLGNKPIRLKCTLCISQSPSKRVSEVKSLKEEKEEALKTIFNGRTLAKAVRTEAVTKVDNGLCIESQVNGNGIMNRKSLIQCVDTAGNVLYIDLRKPTSKYEIQNGTSAISTFTQLQDSTTDNGDYCADLKMRMSDSKILIKNGQMTPSASVHAGQSLLKKNYLMPPQSLLSEICDINGSSEAVQPKLVLGKSHLYPQKSESKSDQNNLLKKAIQILSKISDDCQAVIWLLRELPLIDEHVEKDSELKKQHPYCAPSMATFFTWPVGKRHCAERLRAKQAHSILQTIDSKRFSKWSVRHIITWSRVHALTPLPARKCKNQVQQKNSSVSTFRTTVSEPSEVQDWLESAAEASKTAGEMEDINVVDVPISSQDLKTPVPSDETSNSVNVWMRSKSNLNFLRQPLGRLDIRLAPEALCPGVLYPAAEELLYQACLSFSEDLLRRSVHEAWKRCKQTPNEIVLHDVQNALLSRCEFDLFTNAGLGVQTYEPESTST